MNLRRHAPSLAGKLIIAVVGLMCAVGVAFSLMVYQYQKGVMIESLTGHARFASDIVLSGIYHGMLTAEPQVIESTVKRLSSTEGIGSIMIYNSRDGLTRYSTESKVCAQGDVALFKRVLETGVPDSRLVETPDRGNVLEYITPIKAEPSCFTSSCHYHDPTSGRFLGALQLELTASPVLGASRKLLLGTFAFGTLYTTIISLAIFLILYKIVTRPLGIIDTAMRSLSKGGFTSPIELRTGDEIERLADSFNTMARDIKTYEGKLENWAHELELEVQKKTAEIKAAHEHLVDAEKLASLGRLAAGVAHELNSPLTGILTFAHLMRQRTNPSRAEDIEDLDTIIHQTERCSQIIKGLLGFARKGSSERMPISANDLLKSTVAIVAHQAKFHNVTMNLELAPSLPKCVMDPNQMQQVFLNLLTNATDAMDNHGSITITTSVPSPGQIEIAFSDTGPGIIPEHMGRIFEPFFTTKPVGMGTGLGLPVSYGIVKRHGGDIIVRSMVGRGSTFRIVLPVDRDEEGASGMGVEGG